MSLKSKKTTPTKEWLEDNTIDILVTYFGENFMNIVMPRVRGWPCDSHLGNNKKLPKAHTLHHFLT